MANFYLLNVELLTRTEANKLLQAGKIKGPYEKASIEKERILGVERAVRACRKEAEEIARSRGYDIIVSNGVGHNLAPIFGWAMEDYEFYRTA